MAIIFSDIAKQTRYDNSLTVQRYHGGLATTLVTGLKLKDFQLDGSNQNLICLCPIPWQARIHKITGYLDANADFNQSPQGMFTVLNMGVDIKTDPNNGKIMTTRLDLDRTTSNYTLAGWHFTATPRTFNLSAANSAASIMGVNEYHYYYDEHNGYLFYPPLMTGTQSHTLAECFSYETKVLNGQDEERTIVMAENAVGVADKDYCGMLAWISTSDGQVTTGGDMMFEVTYVEPSPSGIVDGSIVTNS